MYNFLQRKKKQNCGKYVNIFVNSSHVFLVCAPLSLLLPHFYLVCVLFFLFLSLTPFNLKKWRKRNRKSKRIRKSLSPLTTTRFFFALLSIPCYGIEKKSNGSSSTKHTRKCLKTICTKQNKTTYRRAQKCPTQKFILQCKESITMKSFNTLQKKTHNKNENKKKNNTKESDTHIVTTWEQQWKNNAVKQQENILSVRFSSRFSATRKSNFRSCSLYCWCMLLYCWCCLFPIRTHKHTHSLLHYLYECW